MQKILLLLLLLLLPVSALADLGASVTLVTGDPAAIYPGQETRLEITLANTGDTEISAVGFDVPLPGTYPDGLKISSAATYTCTDPEGNTEVGTGTLTAAVDSQSIKLTGGSIPARADNTSGVCKIIVPVTAGTSTGSSVTYTFEIEDGAVTGDDSSDTVANNGAVSQSINVLDLAKPTITKEFDSSSVDIGGNATTLTFTVANSNPVPIPDFSITDTFPTLGGSAIIEVADPPNASSSCSSGGAPDFSPSATATSVTATGTIPANGSCTFSVDVIGVSTNGSYDTGNQTNRISKDDDFSNDLGISAASDATARIRVRSPLGVTKSFSPSRLASGTEGQLTIELTNVANTPLDISSFTDSPIDGVVGVGGSVGELGSGLRATEGTTTCGGTVNVIDGGDGIELSGSNSIPANGSCTITVDFTAAAMVSQVPISYMNSLAAGAVDVDNDAIVSQPSSASILVADILRVEKSASPAEVAPGNPVQYTVTVQNFSDEAISNVTVNDTLPGNVTYLTGTINGNDYSPSSTCGNFTETSVLGAANAQFTIPTLPARTTSSVPGVCTLSFWGMVDSEAGDAASIVNTIAAGDICYNDGIEKCNGSAATSGTVKTEATVLSAEKRFNDTTDTVIHPEGTIETLSITLTNISANPLTAVTISDTFPTDGSGQLQVANPANAVTTCGGTLEAIPGANSFTLNGATVPARANNGTGANGSCVVSLDVIGPAGTYDNVAQVEAKQTYANGDSAENVFVNTNTARLVYLSSLTAEKSFTPGSISSGGTSRVTVRLANEGAVALTNVTVTDPLPEGMVLADPVNASSTCAGSPIFTAATSGANTVTMSGASIAGSGSCDVQFDVTVTGSSSWSNVIPSGNITADGGVRNVADVSATLEYLDPTAISVTKTSNPSTLTFPGQTSELTLSFTNGNLAVTHLAVTDYFTLDGTAESAANGMAIAATPNISTTCPGGVVSATSGGSKISVSNVSLEAGASCEVKVNVTSSAVGGITNVIPIGAVSSDQGLSNNGPASTSLTTQSNIGVEKSFSPKVVKPNERSRLRITFYNPTGQAMANLSVLDTLPAGVTVPSGADPMSTCSGANVSAPEANQVQVSGANLGAAIDGTAASCYAEIDVIGAAQGEYTNTIAAGAVTATAGGVAVDNAQPASDTLFVKNPLVIHTAFDDYTLDSGDPVGMTTGSSSALPGKTSRLTIRLDNPNHEALTGVALLDALPENLVIAQTPNASTTCDGGFVDAQASATAVRLSGATVPATGYCTLSVDVLSNVSGNYVNTIPASAVTSNEGVSNEEPTSAEVMVSAPPVVDKQFAPAVIGANGVTTLTIVFSNDNDSDTTLTSEFVDNLPSLPGSIVVADSPNIGGTCPGTVTAAAGSTSITYAAEATIPAGGCTIQVDVTGDIPGEYNNNIPAGSLQTTVGANQQAANSGLIISSFGYISGTIYNDNNVTPNGIFEMGTDSPVSGVSVELREGDSCSGDLIESTLTDSLGNYLFATLEAGTYSICQPMQPEGTINGATTAGAIVSSNSSTGSSGTESNPTTTSSQIVGIVLDDDGTSGEISGSTGNNFAEIIPSTISGTAFLDQNNNGEMNGTDTPLADVVIELLNADGDLIATTVTDANGGYSFNDLIPGNYSIRQPSQPDGTSSGLTSAGPVTNGGTAGTVTDPTTVPSQINSIQLPPNTTTENNNFAEIPNSRRISGTLLLDYNNNGIVDGTDHGIGNQTITLTGTDISGNPVSMTTTTAADGSYSFTDLPEGTYTLNQSTQPEGTTNGVTTAGSDGATASNPTDTSSQIANIVLSADNPVSGGNNFAEVPGAAADLALAKTHSPTSLGAGSSTGFYTLTPSNIGSLDTSGTMTVVDTLPYGLTSLSVPTSGDWSCSTAGQVITCTSNEVIAAGEQGSDIILRVAVADGLAGQLLTNTGTIFGGGEPSGFDGNNSASDPTAISESASVSGHVWRDTNHNQILDNSETPLADWIVELTLDNTLVASTTTDSSGNYQISGIAPGSGYQLRFRDPESGIIYGRPVPNETGATYSNGVVSEGNPAGADNTDGTLAGLTFVAGAEVVEQSLPFDPSGVVYDAVTRSPVAGAIVSISGPATFDPAIHLVGGEANVTQITGESGYYQYLLLPTAPAGTYTLGVTPPAGYLPTASTMIPVCSNTPTVGALPDPAAVQASADPPQASATLQDGDSCPADSRDFAASGNSTQYYTSFNFEDGVLANVINNHFPIDPVLEGAITLVKTSPLVNVSIGQLVPYTITAVNNLAAPLSNIDLYDVLPPGFKFKSGSATLDGVTVTPEVNNRTLRLTDISFTANGRRTVKMLLVVGSGVQTGEYVNTAQMVNNLVPAPDNAVSNRATATVRVIPDPLFDCSDVIGKVFDDQNANGYQDDGEPGLPNIRVTTARGLLVTSDAEGRYHVTCAMVPNEFRGSNFIMKLDERSLPSGYRVTTENPRTVHLTRGKMAKLNFGAAIHRVVRFEMTNAAFDAASNAPTEELMQAITALPEQLRAAPSIIRLAYNQQGESPGLIKSRLSEVRKQIESLWEAQGCCYTLVFEEEIFQRDLQVKGGEK
ncbi:conserved repeat domain-containing protein [Desulfuromusa kysingii]|uniref:Conserved repeat domain-containing protein n=1 Tax=Desulfuromusa kysingii TaxID=37625 RepID=A0A1H4DG40_9BACT|nr:SdrD B-like domain-containing protein [Desulfuromusa kysingii]SEA71803.1 conserved repeat domain-containing protein [Desulfuromusa kysingii]